MRYEDTSGGIFVQLIACNAFSGRQLKISNKTNANELLKMLKMNKMNKVHKMHELHKLHKMHIRCLQRT